MGAIRGFDHVNVTVTDLELVTDFFVRLGLEVEGRASIEGEFIDAVLGTDGARSHIVMLRPPGGGTALELSRFERPDALPGDPDAPAHALGLRAVSFVVDNVREEVARLAEVGYRLVGDVGEHEGTWAMAYVRGPEGILVSLASRIDG